MNVNVVCIAGMGEDLASSHFLENGHSPSDLEMEIGLERQEDTEVHFKQIQHIHTTEAFH